MPSGRVMSEFKQGRLRSGSPRGPKVRSRRQALAIMLAERRKEGKYGKHVRRRRRAKIR